MQITLGGFPVQCAVAEAENLAHLGLPAPPEFHRANSLLNPLGESPARGWFLLLRQHLDRLDLNALHAVVMADDLDNTVTAKNLVIAREPLCLTPSGQAADPAACHLVEVADARWRVNNPYYTIAVNAQYNVPAPGWASTDYYADTTNGGAAWTWSGMIGDLWSRLSVQLGTYPGLPITPDGTPERFRYLGVSAWRALCQILDRLGCAVRWDAAAGRYTLVSIGAADAATESTLSRAAGRLILDRRYQSVVRGRVPAGVLVHFHRRQEYRGTEPATPKDTTQYTTSGVYTVQVDGPAALTLGAEPGTYHPLWDDQSAVYNAPGVLQNGAALAARAQDRMANFYHSIQGSGGGRRHQVYSGLVSVAPGATVRGVIWRQDRGGLGDPEHPGGLLTEIVRSPWTALRVTDNGQFTEALADSSALHPPDLRIREPVYPDLNQMVRLTTGLREGNGYYDAIVQLWDPDLNHWVDHESIWVLDAND